MKKIIGIVSEYNPFHDGHVFHIQETRRSLGEDSVVVCVMSGDFVQRGEWAIQPKFIRAKAACEGGADAVFELPLPWSLSSAQRFASGAVGMLLSLGISHLSFGSEEGNLERICEAAETLASPGVAEEVTAQMRRDPSLSYPSARSLVLRNNVLDQPNNLLGAEYLLALRGTGVVPFTVKRTGMSHDEEGEGDLPSARELRRKILEGALDTPHADPAVLSLACLSRLRMFDRDYFETLPDCGDGLGYRLYEAVRNSSTLPEIFDSAKTKRYTHSRIRRCVMCAVLGIRKGDNEGLPPYARLLAANERGRAWLSAIRKEKAIPVLIQPKQLRTLDARAQSVFAAGASAHDFYLLGYRADRDAKCGEDYRTGPSLV